MIDTMIFNILCFSIEFFKVTFLLLSLFGTGFTTLKRFAKTLSLSVLTVGSISCFVDLNEVLFGYTVILFLGFAFALKNKKDILFVIIMYIYICIIDMSINGILMYAFDLTVEEISNDREMYTVLNLPSLFIFILISLVRLKKHDVNSAELVKGQRSIMLIGGAAITFYMTSIQLFAFSDMNKKYIQLTSIALSLGNIIFIIILFKLNKSNTVNKYLKNETLLVNRMLKTQEEYYLMLLEKEKATRAFRHDMKYHLKCINKLYMDNRTDEFEQYMKELTATFENLKMDIDTGSSLINAIVIDLSSKFRDVDFKCSGHFYEKISISSLDICTIFFNILKNAYEAAVKTEEKQIELSIGYVGANMFIRLKNSALKKPVMKEKRYISDKADEEHGYGLQNVMDCVERLGGKFRMSYEDKSVIVEIVLFNALPVAYGD